MNQEKVVVPKGMERAVIEIVRMGMEVWQMREDLFFESEETQAKRWSQLTERYFTIARILGVILERDVDDCMVGNLKDIVEACKEGLK